MDGKSNGLSVAIGLLLRYPVFSSPMRSKSVSLRTPTGPLGVLQETQLLRIGDAKQALTNGGGANTTGRGEPKRNNALKRGLA